MKKEKLAISIRKLLFKKRKKFGFQGKIALAMKLYAIYMHGIKINSYNIRENFL